MTVQTKCRFAPADTGARRHGGGRLRRMHVGTAGKMGDMAARRSAGEHGFTLLEVLVAFAIAAPALILLFGQGATSVGAARSSAMYAEAISRAKSRLEAFSERSLQPGETNGDDGGGFRWRTSVVPLRTVPARHRPPRATPYATGTTLFAVTVELTWPGSGARAVTLETRRLGPAIAGGP